MQTILGAGGAIGNELAKVLTDYTNKIRLVSRNPKRVNDDDELVAADLTIEEEVYKAVEGSKIVYLTVGLPYKARVWKRDWPVIMRNVMNACMDQDIKLVFVDNIYMYHHKFLENMNERTPTMPLSRKGKVRHRISKMLLGEMNLGTLQGVIARSADFYGPALGKKSILTEMVFEPLSKGKKAIWPGSAKRTHSFTYVPDAARAIAIMGNTREAYGEIWHIPTAPDPPTGKEWVKLIARELGAEPKYKTLSTFMVAIMGLFVPVMRSFLEMMYQYRKEYIFDSTKFEERFRFTPTSYIEGIREVVEKDYGKTLWKK